MNGKVWTAEELEQLSPAEQDALFQAGIVRDLDDLPVELQPLVERMRARAEARIAGRDLPNAS
jgi:hypothetical protein